MKKKLTDLMILIEKRVRRLWVIKDYGDCYYLIIYVGPFILDFGFIKKKNK